MYLITIYFDEKTTQLFETYMRQIAKHTGNDVMLQGNVPPHLTISAFYTKEEKKAVEIFGKIASKISSGELNWVSIGSFQPNVLFLAPVLNEYLHRLSEICYNEVKRAGAEANVRYLPFCWMPHTTVGKMLTKEQMQKAFAVIQNQFSTVRGKVECIGLAKTNPYTELEKIVLK